MADDSALEHEIAPGNDYAQHEATYLGFIRLLKWVVAANVIVLILLAYFLG
jgi:Ni,Fe-hydrogenase I cytochrome b subunit